MSTESCRDFAASEDPTDEHCQTCGHELNDHRDDEWVQWCIGWRSQPCPRPESCDFAHVTIPKGYRLEMSTDPLLNTATPEEPTP